MANVAALLLAAGESTRMGEPKALLPWHGRTLLEYQVASLRSAGISRAIVVLGHKSDLLCAMLEGLAKIESVYNPDYRQGKTTSVKAGLRGLQRPEDDRPGHRETALLILSVDQPRSPDTIRRIMQQHEDLSRSRAPSGQPYLITIPTYGGKGGHPLVISTLLLAELMEISEDTRGIKAVVRRHAAETQRVEIDAPEILLDLNTPEDYHRALKRPAPGALTEAQRGGGRIGYENNAQALPPPPLWGRTEVGGDQSPPS